jgi:hypothetical protein
VKGNLKRNVIYKNKRERSQDDSYTGAKDTDRDYYERDEILQTSHSGDATTTCEDT